MFGEGTGDRTIVLATVPLLLYARHVLVAAGVDARRSRLARAALGWLPGGIAIVADRAERRAAVAALTRVRGVRARVLAALDPAAAARSCAASQRGASRRGAPRRFRSGELAAARWLALPELVIPFAVVAALIADFTILEAAALTVVYAVTLELAIARRLRVAALWPCSAPALAWAGALLIVELRVDGVRRGRDAAAARVNGRRVVLAALRPLRRRGLLASSREQRTGWRGRRRGRQTLTTSARRAASCAMTARPIARRSAWSMPPAEALAMGIGGGALEAADAEKAGPRCTAPMEYPH